MPARMLLLLLLASTTAAAQNAGVWNAALTLSATGAFVHAGQIYPSSSTLRAQWTPPSVPVRRYILTIAEKRSSREIVVAGAATATDVTDLKAATIYGAQLRACLDDGCVQYLDAIETPQSATAAEYWRVRGAGRSYAGADRVVADGNVGSHAFRYGPWAGAGLDGRLQLYYNPIQREEKGAKIAEPIAAPITTLDDAATFRGVSGYGLLRLCDAPPGSPIDPQCAASRSLAAAVALYQAVPVTPAAGGFVRLYFEAQGYDGRTRILHLDSQDGYIGRDFHRGAATRCSVIADYAAGGGCEPALDIGVDLDGAQGFAGIQNARQFKIGVATRASTAWDMAPGSFMWFTTEWTNGRCSTFGFNAAYATWDGTRWRVEDGGSGCPKLLSGVQAPAPVHLGDARYKLYFNRHRSAGGPTNPAAAIKPMQMLYADGTRSGDPVAVEFEDWEPLDAARDVNYVWPDGTLLSEDEESRLDDYVMLAPLAAEPARLIMYSNMSSSGLGAMPFIGAAVLINP